MGLEKNKRLEKKTRTNRKKKLALKSRTDEKYDFNELPVEILAELIETVIYQGGLVQLYTSADKNAWCIGIRHDDIEPTKLWVKSEGDVKELLEAFKQCFLE